MCRLNFLLLLSCLISSVLFICYDTGPVFDDSYSLRDIELYTSEGVGSSSLAKHHNPAGPGAYAWVAIVSSLLGVAEAETAESRLDFQRFSILLSWFLLFAVTYWLSKSIELSPHVLLLPLLVMPHTPTAMSTLLTEGPALLFALSGLLIYQFASVNCSATLKKIALMSIGAVFIGIAIVSRQYYFALLPALGLTALAQFKTSSGLAVKDIVNASFPVFIALLPVGLLAFLWGGLSSPQMQQGASYSGIHAGIGLSPFRVFSCLLYIAIYCLPFSLPLWSRLSRRKLPKRFYVAIVFSLVGAYFVNAFSDQLFYPGPISSIRLLLGESYSWAQFVFQLLVGGIATFNVCLLSSVLIDKWSQLNKKPLFPIAVLFLVFFVIENLFIGGDIGFFERYILQIAPFLGIVLFGLVDIVGERYTYRDYLLFICLSIIGHIMLWRFVT